jgi:alkaline phosphatase D
VPVARGGTFAQGVASGQQTTTGITLWSRVAGLEGGPRRVQFEVGRDPGFGSVVHRQDAIVTPEGGFTALQRVEGLAPGEEYFYRCSTCDVSSSVGRLRTALPADSQQPVRIGFFSCQAWESGFYTAHAGLAAEDLDLVVCLGDYVYEYGTESGAAEVRRDRTGGTEDGAAETLAEWREKYALYHSDPRLVAVRQQFPLVAIWDDHEVENNYAGDVPDPPSAPEPRTVPFAQRRRNGYDAFFEHMPRIRVAGDADRIYGSIPLGGMAEVFLLDQRQYRSDQPNRPDGEECLALPTCRAEADAPGRTLLGDAQKAWLKDGLERSRAAWKVVGNQVMIMALDAAPEAPLNYDQWDGYSVERAELLDHVGTRVDGDVTFVTGDIHTFFAGDVAPNGRARPGSPSVATEFVSGSISSKGIADTLGGEDGRETVAVPVDAEVERINPHIKLSNQSFKGYSVVACGPREMTVTYRSPRTTQEPESPMFDLAKFVVRRGEPAVQVESRSDRPGA